MVRPDHADLEQLDLHQRPQRQPASAVASPVSCLVSLPVQAACMSCHQPAADVCQVVSLPLAWCHPAVSVSCHQRAAALRNGEGAAALGLLCRALGRRGGSS